MASLADKMAMVGDPIPDEDQIAAITNSLPESYDPQVSALLGQLDKLMVSNEEEAISNEFQSCKNRDGNGGDDERALLGAHGRQPGKAQSRDARRKVKCCNSNKWVHIRRECREERRPTPRPIAHGPTPRRGRSRGPSRYPYKSHLVGRQRRGYYVLCYNCKWHFKIT